LFGQGCFYFVKNQKVIKSSEIAIQI